MNALTLKLQEIAGFPPLLLSDLPQQESEGILEQRKCRRVCIATVTLFLQFSIRGRMVDRINVEIAVTFSQSCGDAVWSLRGGAVWVVASKD